MSANTIAQRVIQHQIQGLTQLEQQLDGDFEAAIERILASQQSIVVTGVGKSGLIGKKIMATLASTGTPAFFMHPTEAFHGDLGMVLPGQLVIAISYSGETAEVMQLMPFFENNGNPVIAMTGNPESSLAKAAAFHLNVQVASEACALNLAPTTSTTATLVMGDALAVALMELRGFEDKDFARFHPGGSLGRRLLHKARDEMHSEALPMIDVQTEGKEVIGAMSKGRLGLAIVMQENQLVGLITDGDLRRGIEKFGASFFTTQAKDFMSSNPRTIEADVNVMDAWSLMDQQRITSLLVTDQGQVVGVLKK